MPKTRQSRSPVQQLMVQPAHSPEPSHASHPPPKRPSTSGACPASLRLLRVVCFPFSSFAALVRRAGCCCRGVSGGVCTPCFLDSFPPVFRSCRGQRAFRFFVTRAARASIGDDGDGVAGRRGARGGGGGEDRDEGVGGAHVGVPLPRAYAAPEESEEEDRGSSEPKNSTTASSALLAASARNALHRPGSWPPKSAGLQTMPRATPSQASRSSARRWSRRRASRACSSATSRARCAAAATSWWKAGADWMRTATVLYCAARVVERSDGERPNFQYFHCRGGGWPSKLSPGTGPRPWASIAVLLLVEFWRLGVESRAFGVPSRE